MTDQVPFWNENHSQTVEFFIFSFIVKRDLKDVLRVRGEVANDIAVQVRARLALPEQAARRNISPDAYDAYLVGTRLANQGSSGGFEKSIVYLERAIALDPKFALAYTQLAESHGMLASWSASRGDHFRKAVAYSHQAMRLDPTLPEARIGDADLKFYWQWDWSQCDSGFRTAA